MGTEKLTPAQHAAVYDRGGPLLVSAAAGSGKTKVLVDRLMSYLLDPSDPANIDDFLIITYTKAAASELREKIAGKLTEILSQTPENRHLRRQLQRLHLAKISTVHAFCGDIIREYAFFLELSGDVRVADENEAAELRHLAMEETLEEAYTRVNVTPEFRAFVDTQGFGRDDRTVPQIVEAVYTSAHCHIQPEKWLRTCLRLGETHTLTDAAQTIWGKYLVDRLHNYLRTQIKVLRDLLETVQQDDELAPKYCPTLEENLTQLEALYQCKTWEECQMYRIDSLGRLKPVRNPSDPELVEAVKAVRKSILEGLKKYQLPFQTGSLQILDDLEQANLACQGLCQLVLDFTKRYQLEKQRRRVLDFSDLEHRTLELLLGKSLSGPTQAAKEISRRFREVMVDEYQDTNEVQDKIFSVLTAKQGNCFMVGDVKQSIYRFRLADPGIFLEKYHTFVPHSEAQPGQGRKILLSENFRSGEGVLAAANHVFATTMCPDVGGLYYGAEESLKAGIPHEKLPTPEVELHCIELQGGAPKYETESLFVAQRIRQMLDNGELIRSSSGLRKVTPGDIVILLRSPGTAARHYRSALESLGIPAATESGGSILQTSEISILRSLLEVLDNPLQDIPLQSVLLSPLCDFSADDLGRLRAAHRQGYLFESLLAARNQGDRKATDFLNMILSLRQVARQETLTRLLEEISIQTHMESIFGAMPSGQQRLDNLQFFHETAAAFEQGGLRDLSEFLEHLSRLDDRGLISDRGSTAASAVTILSIHKSKGLEYPVVFLANLSARFNREDLKDHVLVDPELGIGASALNVQNRSRYPTIARAAIAQRIKDENASEELRVLYVAMTRAKDRLIMTYADKYIRGHLEDLARRLTPSSAYTLSREAGALGHWVLMAAMCRSEAAELFQLAGRPPETISDGHPWRITINTIGPQEESVSTAATEIPVGLELPDTEVLRNTLGFRYPHPASVDAPAKITATQLKGRMLDEEAADGAFQRLPATRRHFRIPEPIAHSPMTGKEIGTATHLAMQFIRYEACADLTHVEQELLRLMDEAYITKRQFEAVNREWIATFFATDLGHRLRTGENILREFKFSILEKGETIDPDLQGEELLLQGVVDCCITEDDGLTILDFKTDRVSAGGEDYLAARYAPQVRAYGRALGRIWDRPVKKLLLYFFQTGQLVEIVPGN